MDRRTITLICNADDEMLASSWDELSWDVRDIIEEMGGLFCDGGGVPGFWCKHCYWFEEEEEY